MPKNEDGVWVAEEPCESCGGEDQFNPEECSSDEFLFTCQNCGRARRPDAVETPELIKAGEMVVA